VRIASDQRNVRHGACMEAGQGVRIVAERV
jgi:hypothetical protein